MLPAHAGVILPDHTSWMTTTDAPRTRGGDPHFCHVVAREFAAFLCTVFLCLLFVCYFGVLLGVLRHQPKI